MTSKDPRTNKDDYHTFFTSVDDLLFVLDLKGNILQFNPEVPRRLGYTSEEISSMRVVDIYSAEFKDEVEETLENILKNKTLECDIPMQAKD